jgi:hypothetical protein
MRFMSNGTLTEADILTEVINPEQPGLPPELAAAILDWKFSQQAIQRMNELAEKNRQGILGDAEKADLEKYLRVGTFLNLLQAKARLSLGGTTTPPR